MPKQSEFVLAVDERGGRVWMNRLEPGLYGALSRHTPSRHRPCKALELLAPKILQFEGVADKEPRGRADHHLSWLRHPLQAGRQIRRRPGHRFGLRRDLAHEVADDDLTGGDADPSPERSAVAEL